jgi:hypothetical protein
MSHGAELADVEHGWSEPRGRFGTRTGKRRSLGSQQQHEDIEDGTLIAHLQISSLFGSPAMSTFSPRI